ncbi:hypothetical protein C6W27_12985 [Bacillus paralicheniformis]|nr:hypothetical protein C6W27_12985 [Bacillus paralicheniformis]
MLGADNGECGMGFGAADRTRISRLSRRRLRYKRLKRFHFEHNEIIRVAPRFIRPFSFKGRMGLFILKWKEGFT